MKPICIAALLLVVLTAASCEKERCYTCTEVVVLSPYVAGRSSYKETTICGYTDTEKKKHEDEGSSSKEYNDGGTIVSETKTTRCLVDE